MYLGGHIVPELFDQILDDIEGCDHAIQLGPVDDEDDSQPYCPTHALHPLLFICKSWHVYVERHLYQHISVGEDKLGWKDPKTATLLADTLVNNPRLASMVRKFRLRSIGASGREQEQMCSDFAQILAQCKRLTSLRILNWECSDLGIAKLKSSIRELKDLQTLSFDLDRSSPGFVNLFDSCDELLQYMMEWPNLTYLMLSLPCPDWDEEYAWPGELDGPDGDSQASSTTSETTFIHAKRNALAYLHEFYLYAHLSIHVSHLQALVTMAPNLKGFACIITDVDLQSRRHAFRAAIQAWAPNLHNLAILTRPTQSRIMEIENDSDRLLNSDVCRQLDKLRVLAYTSQVLAATLSLAHFTSLTWLLYAPTMPKNVDDLLGILPKLTSLESLCFSTDWLKSHDKIDYAEALQASCTSKGIHLEYD